MKKSDQHFWPYKPKISIHSAIILLIVLLLITGILRSTIGWPSDGSTNTVLIGILLISLLPVLLAILDVIIDRGGKIGYGDFKIDFSKDEKYNFSGITVPANIGVRGLPVSDSDTVNILEALQQATTSSIAIIDLEDGKAWWETRLLVLISGAQRLGHPDKIVFVATRSGKEKCFIGWANPENLLNRLLKVHPKYEPAYYIAKAVSNQWNLVEPFYPSPPPVVQIPIALPWMLGKAMYKQDWAYDINTGLTNELFQEQVLQNELGLEVEKQEGGRSLTIGRIIDLFDQVLNKNHIDQDLSSEQQLENFFDNDISFIALTQNGVYKSLISRFVIYNEIMKKLTGKTNDK